MNIHLKINPLLNNCIKIYIIMYFKYELIFK